MISVRAFAFAVVLGLLSLGAQAQIPGYSLKFSNFTLVQATDSEVVLFALPGQLRRACASFRGQAHCYIRQIDMKEPLQIRFATNHAGIARLMQISDTEKIANSSENIVFVGETAEIAVNWADICAYATGDRTCATPGVAKVIVGIDPYGDGFTTGNLSNSLFKQVLEIEILPESKAK